MTLKTALSIEVKIVASNLPTKTEVAERCASVCKGNRADDVTLGIAHMLFSLQEVQVFFLTIDFVLNRVTILLSRISEL